jgi:cyclophilin family peptidyl-prolyl cis-trans isomerase/HEAT repeat protein
MDIGGRMGSRGAASTLLAAALTGALAGCAASTPAPTAPPPAAPPTRAFSSPEQARALLLQLEDRRAFDPGILGAAARHSDAGVRAHAALAAGRIGDDRGREIVSGLLSDPAAGVRSSAAFACQLLEDGNAVPGLIALLQDPDPAVAGSAARAIGTLGRGDGQDALIAAIPAAPSPEPRATMLQSLWRWADPPSAAAAMPYVSDPDAKVRGAALYVLSRKPIESSLPALTAALSDAEADIAAGAARALGILARKESVEPLAAALDSGKAHLVTSSLNALEAILEKSPGVALAPETRARVIALAGDASPNLAIPALVLLRQLVASDREALSRVWSIATTGKGRRRQVALTSAVAALRERARSALDAALESPEAPLRAAAAESLSYLPQSLAGPYRTRLAEDPDPLVRIAVLAGLRSAEAVRDNGAVLDAAFADRDPGVRAAAIEALVLANDTTVLPRVLQAVERSSTDAAPDVAIAGIAEAEKLRSLPEARGVVEAAYRIPKTLVQRLARRSLVRTFRADPAAFPAPEYRIARTEADYAALLAEAGKPWRADIETVRGAFRLRLLGAEAPMTAMNFVDLARKSFFDGIAIHRVVPDFVVQDGDPTGTGNGGPGYEIRDENDAVPYGTGTVGMALAGPDTGGSQWFVTHAPQPHLDGIYTVFGQVVAGQDVVERLEQWDRITRVTVSEGQ